MDILTPKGQRTLEQEREAVRLFTRTYSGYGFVETPKSRPADIDGFVVFNGAIVSGVEVRCRNLTLADLKHKFDNRWLITSDKVDRGISLCRSLGVDFRGFLYLVPDRTLLIVPVWSYEKGMIADIDLEHTVTQATVNGGTALRLNAYVDVTGATAVVEH